MSKVKGFIIANKLILASFFVPVLLVVLAFAVTGINHMDCIVHGILQARILEWVASPFSRGSSQSRDRT